MPGLAEALRSLHLHLPDLRILSTNGVAFDAEDTEMIVLWRLCKCATNRDVRAYSSGVFGEVGRRKPVHAGLDVDPAGRDMQPEGSHREMLTRRSES